MKIINKAIDERLDIEANSFLKEYSEFKNKKYDNTIDKINDGISIAKKGAFICKMQRSNVEAENFDDAVFIAKHFIKEIKIRCNICVTKMLRFISK